MMVLLVLANLGTIQTKGAFGMQTPTAVDNSRLCGIETPLGPCTMKKGHAAQFHRHVVYETTNWEIYDTGKGNKLLSKGSGILPLQYAIAEAFEVTSKIIIYANRSNSSSG